MGRTPLGNDAKLIKSGTALARAKGLNGFTVREVCAKSKVNLGMFHYYFTSKDNFDMAVLKALYSEMLDNINIEVSPSKSPRENTAVIMRAITIFVRTNRILLSALAGDVFTGNTKIIKFVAGNFNMHVLMLAAELKRAKKARLLSVPDVLDAVVILIPSVALPQIILGLLSRLDLALPGKLTMTALGKRVDRWADKRIELLLNTVFKGQ